MATSLFNWFVRYHPDKASADVPEEMFKSIGDAYSQLSDALNRRKHDREHGLRSTGWQ